jgi:hypothetical protein
MNYTIKKIRKREDSNLNIYKKINAVKIYKKTRLLIKIKKIKRIVLGYAHTPCQLYSQDMPELIFFIERITRRSLSLFYTK